MTGDSPWVEDGPLTPNGAPDVFASGFAVGVDGQGNVVVGAILSGGELEVQGTKINPGAKRALVVLKFDPLGKLLWARSFTSKLVDIFDLSVNAAGQIAVTGGFEGTIDLGAGATSQGKRDLYAAKFAPDGSTLWSKVWGSEQFDLGYGITLDDAGNAVIVGAHGAVLDVDGQVLNAPSLQMFAARLDNQGKLTWVQGWGAAPGIYGARPRFDGANNVWIVGSFNGTLSVGYGPPFTSKSPGSGTVSGFLAKINGGGIHQLSKKIESQGVGSLTVNTMAVDASGGVLMAGDATSDTDFGGGVLSLNTNLSAGFLASFDAQGNHRWSRALRATKNSPSDPTASVLGVAFRANGDALATGYFQGSLDLGSGALLSPSGQNAAFVGAFSPAGAPLSSHSYQSALGYAVASTQAGLTILTGNYDGSPDFGGGPLPAGQGLFVTTLDF